MMMKPMLAKDGDLDKIGFPQIAQPKLDGIRAMVVDGKLLSRTLKRIPNRAIRAIMETPAFEGFDGELIVGDPTDADCYRNTVSFVMSESKVGALWSFHAFDLWNQGATPYALRADKLAMLHRRANSSVVRLVEGLRVNNLQELEDIEVSWLADGLEGVILRNPSAPYKFGRSGKTGPLLKVKRFIDFEAEVIGVYEEQHNANERFKNELGRGARSSAKAGKVGKGRLGGLVLRAINGPAAGVEFRCGTGFDAEQRALYWAQSTVAGTIIGRTAKIKSFPIGAKDKPRHPVFLGWRDMSIDG